MKYLGTINSEQGIKPDPDKVNAISNMPVPTDKAGVRRLLGMVNFLANHIPNMSTITAPLRDLVKAHIFNGQANMTEHLTSSQNFTDPTIL